MFPPPPAAVTVAVCPQLTVAPFAVGAAGRFTVMFDNTALLKQPMLDQVIVTKPFPVLYPWVRVTALAAIASV